LDGIAVEFGGKDEFSGKREVLVMTYTDDDLKSALLFVFSPEVYLTLDRMQEEFEDAFLKGKRHHLELPFFQEAFRRLIAEDPRSFSELLGFYMEDGDSDEGAEEHFREVWKIVMGDEPWPEEQVRNGGKKAE
jgi:hypothetical protein